MIEIRDIVVNHIQWLIGAGEINVCKDKWLDNMGKPIANMES